MTKHASSTFLGGFLSILILAALASVTSVSVCSSQETNVNGIISSDITWTKANSPYNLTGKVLVNGGVTLTIEAGATVNLNNYYIRVIGTFRAKGTSADKIYINGGDHQTSESGIHLWNSETSWNEQTDSGCIIDNVKFNSCPVSVANTTKIVNNDGAFFSLVGGSSITTYNSNCGFEVYSGSPIISNNSIVSGINVFDASPIISNNRIIGGGIWVKGLKATLITDNTISGSFSSGCIQ